MESGKGSKTHDRAKFQLAAVFVVFLLVTADPWAIGVAAHEWASFLLIIPIALWHIQVDWKWIAAVTRRVFRKQPGATRFNFLLDWLLFVYFSALVISGILISESALPFFGIPPSTDPFWIQLHSASAYGLVFALGIHVAMHWKWIVSTTKAARSRKRESGTAVRSPGMWAIFPASGTALLQIGTIVLAGFVISVGVMQLDATGWADQMRQAYVARGPVEPDPDGPALFARILLSILFILPKIAFTALVTAGVVRVWRLLAAKKRVATQTRETR